MKKYYCATCKRFKNRWQLTKDNDSRVAWYVCRWCHKSQIYTTEQIIEKMAYKMLSDEDLESRHGGFY